jgi:hypothetical protein
MGITHSTFFINHVLHAALRSLPLAATWRAAPDDTLAVKILDLQLDSDQVWGLSHPGLAL